MSWLEICAVEDINPNMGVCALFEGEQVAIFRVGSSEQVYALSNHCPAGNANVLSRGLLGDADGELFVASPLYKQRFALTDGRCLDDEALSVTAYKTKVEQGKVLLAR